MKKALALVATIGVLVSTLWVNAGTAGAAGLINYRGGLYVGGKGIVFVFDASGFRNRDVRGANIFVGSNFHDLGCTANKEEAKIVCVLRGGLTQHAGETGVIYLAGQVFYVTIPGRDILEDTEEDGGFACSELESLGAWVSFEYFGGEFYADEFIEGESLGEVDEIASEIASGDETITSYEISDFGCWDFSEEAVE